jgi:hypothetical protein
LGAVDICPIGHGVCAHIGGISKTLLHFPLINPFRHWQLQLAYETEANTVPARIKVIEKENLNILFPRVIRGTVSPMRIVTASLAFGLAHNIGIGPRRPPSRNQALCVMIVAAPR